MYESKKKKKKNNKKGQGGGWGGVVKHGLDSLEGSTFVGQLSQPPFTKSWIPYY